MIVAHVILEHVGSVLAEYSMRISTQPSSTSASPPPYDTSSRLTPSSNFFRLASEGASPNSSLTSLCSSDKDLPLKITGSEMYQPNPIHISTARATTSNRTTLLVFSANDEKALQSNIKAIGSIAENYDAAHLAYTLASRRSRFSHRAFVVAPPATIKQSLEEASVISVKSQRSSH